MALRKIRSNAPTPPTDKIVVASFNSDNVRNVWGHTLTSRTCFQNKLERCSRLLHLISDLLNDGLCSAEGITDHDTS